jgi:hypothetical protein
VEPIHADDLAQLHTQITQVCAELGWAPPLWLETTVEDPGGGQARLAGSRLDSPLTPLWDGYARESILHEDRSRVGPGGPPV